MIEGRQAPVTGADRAAMREDHRVAHGLMDSDSVLLAIHHELTVVSDSLARLVGVLAPASETAVGADVALREPAPALADVEPRQPQSVGIKESGRRKPSRARGRN